MNEEKKDVCVICGCDIYDFGNNAEPVKNGRCCDTCNDTVVIPKRIEIITNQ